MREIKVGSSRRKLVPPAQAAQLVLDEMKLDPTHKRGPRDTKEALALKGYHIDRYVFH